MDVRTHRGDCDEFESYFSAAASWRGTEHPAGRPTFDYDETRSGIYPMVFRNGVVTHGGEDRPLVEVDLRREDRIHRIGG